MRHLFKHTNAKRQLEEFRQNSAFDRAMILSLLRRELANYLIRFDPDRFLVLYRSAIAIEAEIEKSDKTIQEAQLDILCRRFPFYRDFDKIATREHVLYADSLDGERTQDIEEHFIDLVRFHALMRALDESWRHVTSATSANDLDHLCKYVIRIKGDYVLEGTWASRHIVS